MADTVSAAHGLRILHCAVDGPTLADEAGAVELIALALAQKADLIVVPVARLDARFFTLSTGLAGAIVQKLVNYRLRLAVLGDISGHLAASSSFRDWVRESNRGRQTWFVDTAADLEARLAAG